MEFAIGALAGMSAVVFSNPFEVIKTRLQLQGELKKSGTHVVHYRGPLQAGYVIAKNDGILALQRGLGPALAYQFCMNSVRLGIYQTIDNRGLLRDRHGRVNILSSVGVGAFSGALGCFIASPFNQIKTQMQAMSNESVAVGQQHGHKSGIQAFLMIAREYGIRGLYRGCQIAALRLAVGSSIQLTTFHRSKELLQENGLMSESPLLRAFCASCVSGVFLAAGACPLDVVLTRLYNQGVDSNGRGSMYRGITDCFMKMYKTEGFQGFYKGVLPLYFKSAPHIILVMTFWEQYKILFQKTFA